MWRQGSDTKREKKRERIMKGGDGSDKVIKKVEKRDKDARSVLSNALRCPGQPTTFLLWPPKMPASG